MTPMFQLEIEDDLSTTLREARNGNQEAWAALFNQCYPKVRRVVRRRLNRSLRTIYDSRDFANEAMENLAAHLDQLHFESVGSLIAFLAKIAEQRVIDEHRRQTAAKRDEGRNRSISAGEDEDGFGATELSSSDATASQYAQANEFQDRLLARGDETERRVILLKQQGYTNQEIASVTGWNIRKVQRFLKELFDSLNDSGD